MVMDKHCISLNQLIMYMYGMHYDTITLVESNRTKRTSALAVTAAAGPGRNNTRVC